MPDVSFEITSSQKRMMYFLCLACASILLLCGCASHGYRLAIYSSIDPPIREARLLYPGTGQKWWSSGYQPFEETNLRWLCDMYSPLPIPAEVDMEIVERNGETSTIKVPMGLQEDYSGRILVLLTRNHVQYKAEVVTGPLDDTFIREEDLENIRKRLPPGERSEYNLAVLTDSATPLEDFHCLLGSRRNSESARKWTQNTYPFWHGGTVSWLYRNECARRVPTEATIDFKDAHGQHWVFDVEWELHCRRFCGDIVLFVHQAKTDYLIEPDEYQLLVFFGRKEQFAKERDGRTLAHILLQFYAHASEQEDIRRIQGNLRLKDPKRAVAVRCDDIQGELP
jgi:hypothetical protein